MKVTFQYTKGLFVVEPMIATLITDRRKWAHGSAKDVIPAQAGIQFTHGWMPAFAGMTIGYVLFSE